jgi:ATP-dependent DNA helicase RecG
LSPTPGRSSARPEPSLQDSTQFLKGVGPARHRLLGALGIQTVGELLGHFPRDYYDRRRLRPIDSLPVGEPVTFVGMVQSWNARRISRGRAILTIAVGDDTGYITLVWFNAPYLARIFQTGKRLVVSGEVQYYRGRRQLVNPDFEFLSPELDQDLVHTGRIVPVYPLTRGLSQHWMRRVIKRALERYGHLVPETLPADLIDGRRLVARGEALRSIHFPESEEELGEARRRLKYEELFEIQVLTVSRRRERRGPAHFPVKPPGDLSLAFLDRLPFALTPGQREVLDALESDFASGGTVHRLLQGEVGSGKTVVALAFLLRAIESGHQAAIMAPTEVLAGQHARTVETYLDGLPVRRHVLLGATPAREKREIQEEIAQGRADLLVGTHALIQEAVHFSRLGAVVVDEQHRFGVRQRARLADADHLPHVVVMTATPIPRTLAMTAYGDLDLTVIRDLPPGRRPVTTRIAGPEVRETVMEFVREKVVAGAQAYFVYPLVEETEKQDLLAATEESRHLAREVFPGLKVDLLHGRMGHAEKEEVMGRFREGRTHVLVCTTVVEVGIDVPNATLMVIHHPERFGLSQLHQLRGRIARGPRKGVCILLLEGGVGPVAHRRLEIFQSTTDGFRIAEEDLGLRGPGDLWGTRQHGVPGLRLVHPVHDSALVETVHRDVREIFDRDPDLGDPVSAPVARILEEHRRRGLGGVG